MKSWYFKLTLLYYLFLQFRLIVKNSIPNQQLTLRQQTVAKRIMNHSVSTLTGKTKIKIVFLGNQSVGKSSVIQQYIHSRFEQTSHPTVGIDFLAKNVICKNKSYRLQLWDTAGQQRFRSLIPSYLKDSQCALIMFDVTSKESFKSIDDWIKMYNQNKTGGISLIVGNKIDLVRDREVSTQQGFKKAEELGIFYWQISAKTAQNLETLFLNIIQICTNPHINPTNFKFKGQEESDKIEEVEQKNEEDKQKDLKQLVKPNFSKAKPITKQKTKQTQNQVEPPSKNNQQKQFKIKKTASMIVQTSQIKDDKVIRLQDKKQKAKEQKNCC